MNIIGIVKSSFIDYPAKISCVVFTPYCNMNCWYCHNKEIINIKQGTVDPLSVIEFLKTRIGLLDGVVISGGEPTLQPDLLDYMKQIKQLGFKVKLDSNGTNPEVLKLAVDNNLVDYIAMDIKAPLDDYKKITIVPDIEQIKKSIQFIMNCGIDYEFRTTFAPNLTSDDILKIINDIKGAKRYCLQAYQKPQFITADTLINHTKDEFYDIKQKSNGLVEQFLIKNL